jgi:hypothetical protein
VVTVVAFARRLTGLILSLSMLLGLPIAAARAGCVCDHGHDGSVASAAEKPHVCTSHCTAATCPMHRGNGSAAHDKTGRGHGGGMRCDCAGQAQALIAQATVVGVLPPAIAVDAPLFARPSRTSVAEAPLSLAASPPAPPPRA